MKADPMRALHECYDVITNGYVGAAIIMVLVYGTGVIDHYNDDDCNVEYYRGDTNTHLKRMQGLFFVGAVCVGASVAVWRSRFQDENAKLVGGALLAVAGMATIGASIWYLYLGALSGLCHRPSDSAKPNEKNALVESMPMLAYVSWSLMVAAALWRASFAWSTFNLDDDKNSLMGALERCILLIATITRFTFAAMLTNMFMVGGAKFNHEYVNQTRFGTSMCTNTTQQHNTSAMTKKFEFVDPENTGEPFKMNEAIVVLVYFVMAACCIEAVYCMGYTFFGILAAYGKGIWKDNGPKDPKWMWAEAFGRSCGLFADISLATIVAILLLQNEVSFTLSQKASVRPWWVQI
jgi:hypothetical protein